MKKVLNDKQEFVCRNYVDDVFSKKVTEIFHELMFMDNEYLKPLITFKINMFRVINGKYGEPIDPAWSNSTW